MTIIYLSINTTLGGFFCSSIAQKFAIRLSELPNFVGGHESQSLSLFDVMVSGQTLQ
jgi:hypothetical protein